MQLIGRLDSPYVRRVAISLQMLSLPFSHSNLSVFSSFDAFHALNPVVKAPTLLCDDGTVLMDSTLILDYAEALAASVTPRRSLMPGVIAERQQALRTIGLALAACEKSVQIVYEKNLRPADKLHQPWLERVSAQLLAAYDELEADLQRHPLASDADISQAGISLAVAWKFTQEMIADCVPAENYPLIGTFAAGAEQLPQFCAAPHGLGTVLALG